MDREFLPGQAYFAGSGPDFTTCRTCAFYDAKIAGRRLVNKRQCGKYVDLMMKTGIKHPVVYDIPPTTRSCKYYKEASGEIIHGTEVIPASGAGSAIDRQD
ncbi:MAG TPA: hypothetical protein VKD24_03455 [Candidatus Angelobacter sp.]|nr:hypothetical protein [Candidatus Angelobacter sp.]